jgi:hypothetical protein
VQRFVGGLPASCNPNFPERGRVPPNDRTFFRAKPFHGEEGFAHKVTTPCRDTWHSSAYVTAAHPLACASPFEAFLQIIGLKETIPALRAAEIVLPLTHSKAALMSKKPPSHLCVPKKERLCLTNAPCSKLKIQLRKRTSNGLRLPYVIARRARKLHICREPGFTKCCKVAAWFQNGPLGYDPDCNSVRRGGQSVVTLPVSTPVLCIAALRILTFWNRQQV